MVLEDGEGVRLWLRRSELECELAMEGFGVVDPAIVVRGLEWIPPLDLDALEYILTLGDEVPLPLLVTGDFKALSCNSWILCEDGDEDDELEVTVWPGPAPDEAPMMAAY